MRKVRVELAKATQTGEFKIKISKHLLKALLYNTGRLILRCNKLYNLRQSASSEPSEQSGSKSHFHDSETQLPSEQRNSCSEQSLKKNKLLYNKYK